MPGILLNNSQILELVAIDIIRIEPFNADRLKTAHYPLTAYALFDSQKDSDPKEMHRFDRHDTFTFPPSAYVIVEVRETIVLAPGIVGKFLPSSNLVDQRLGLTAGRVEYPFGQQRETLRFGLKNQCDFATSLSRDDYIAYVEFYDLRGLSTHPVKLTERDAEIYERRRVDEGRFYRANDDGPFYTKDN